jgi:hypothetical protein
MNWISRTIGKIIGRAPAPLPWEVKPLSRFDEPLSSDTRITDGIGSPSAQFELKQVRDKNGKFVGWST